MSDNPPKFGWGHVNISVSNLERSIQFYELLGFELLLEGIPYLGLDNAHPAQPLPDGIAGALDVAQGTRGRAVIMQLDDGFPKIDLTEFAFTGQNSPLKNSDVGLVRLCLLTQDLAGDIAYLKRHGVNFVSELRAAEGELATLAICSDPDGTLIELLQPNLSGSWTISSPAEPPAQLS